MSSIAANRMPCFRSSSKVSSLFDFSQPAEEGRPFLLLHPEQRERLPAGHHRRHGCFLQRFDRQGLYSVSNPKFSFIAFFI